MSSLELLENLEEVFPGYYTVIWLSSILLATHDIVVRDFNFLCTCILVWLLITIRNGETFLPRFSSNSEAFASELKKRFLNTTWTVMLSVGLNLQPHTGVLLYCEKIKEWC